jgi:UDP-N-acetylmuramoyl-tripeptide--D-alanyl-D-alanine ligase
VKKLNKLIIAVAGSNGKTTTKELIAHVLSQRFRTHATAGNYNTEIGLALTVLNAPDDIELLVLEMGTTARGDIAKLCEIAPPTIGVLTSISEEHTATLGDLESVIEAETELLEALPTRGLAVINGDDTQLITIARRKARCPVITFGFAPHNDLVAEELKISRAGRAFISEVLAGRTNFKFRSWGARRCSQLSQRQTLRNTLSYRSQRSVAG